MGYSGLNLSIPIDKHQSTSDNLLYRNRTLSIGSEVAIRPQEALRQLPPKTRYARVCRTPNATRSGEQLEGIVAKEEGLGGLSNVQLNGLSATTRRRTVSMPPPLRRHSRGSATHLSSKGRRNSRLYRNARLHSVRICRRELQQFVEYARETEGIRVVNKNRIIKVLRPRFHENVYPSPPIRCSASLMGWSSSL